MMFDDGEAVSSALAGLGEIEKRSDYPAIEHALTLWTDMLCNHMFAGKIPQNIAVMGATMIRLDAGRRTDFVLGSAQADMEVPAEFQWAGQVISARISLDRPRFERLWDEAPCDAEAFGRHVVAVLTACAKTISRTKRGYALDQVAHRPDCAHGEDCDAT
jgi:hypothetical protein